jgi:guanine nucleotide-binding protein G(i) subunit alpha
MRISHMRGFSSDERAAYQGTVRNNVVEIVEALACITANEYPGLDDTAKVHAAILARELAKWEKRPKNITLEAANAVQGLWQNERLKSTLFDASDVYSSKPAP